MCDNSHIQGKLHDLLESKFILDSGFDSTVIGQNHSDKLERSFMIEKNIETACY